MNITEFIRYRIKGEPHCRQTGGDVRITAKHRLPNSGYEHVLTLYLFGAIGTAFTLVSHYAPDMASDPEANFLLENAAFVIMAIWSVFEALAIVAQADEQALPLEELRGWMFASYWIVGVFLFRLTGLHDLMMWLGNREHVTIAIDDEKLSVRHGTLRFPKRIALDRIEGVLILPNHPTGHDVMLQHKDGLTRLASIYGDQVRPTLFKLRLQQAFATAEGPARTASGQILQKYN